MAHVINPNWRISKDWFTENPGLALAFKDVRKDLGKITASKTMWSLSLVLAPNSPYDNAGEDEKKHIVKEEYYTKIVWDSDKIIKLAERLNKFLVPPEIQFLRFWKKKLDERTAFLDQIEYSAESFSIQEKAMQNMPKMWEQYKKCLAEVEQAESKMAHGDVMESASERGDI